MSLVDSFNRKHTYLRISLTEKCNLRCVYCMPENGIKLMPQKHLMTDEEILALSKIFVTLGVNKIRLTGGEPLVRKNIDNLLLKLSQLPVKLTLTTNGVLVDQHIETFKKAGISSLNLSLDSLNGQTNQSLTRRNLFDKTIENIHLLIHNGFHVKINTVVMRNINHHETVDFVKFTQNLPVHVRFIEFMPFKGNNWEINKSVGFNEILKSIEYEIGKQNIIKLTDKPNDTAKNYKIKNFKGTFAFISTVTQPFCDSCNRIRLTADGKIKNCLFSTLEKDLLTPFRQGHNIVPIIQSNIWDKKYTRGGLAAQSEFENSQLHNQNRSMIAIGG